MEATPIVAAVIMLAPFVAYLVNEFFGGWLKERAHWVSLTLVGISAFLSLAVFGMTVWRSLTDPHFHGSKCEQLIGMRRSFFNEVEDFAEAQHARDGNS